VKSDRSAEVLHHFGLGRTVGFQAAVSDTSGGKHPESPHELTVRRMDAEKWSGRVTYIRPWPRLIPQTFTVTSEHMRFFLLFSFSVLHF